MIQDRSHHRSPLLHGLGLTLRRFPAVLWAFAFNFLYAAINTASLSSGLSQITSTSLAAHSLHHGFDLGTTAALFFKIMQAPGPKPSFGPAILLYLATYFLLVPGTLLCYQTGVPARLSTLLQAGLMHFWRFVRITLLTLMTMGLVLGVLAAAYARFADAVDQHMVGRPAFLVELTALLFIALVAAALRLYFDLVEVYTVQLGLHLRTSGKPDRRVRKALGPALRALRANFAHAYATFLLLAFLGFAAVALTARIAIHSLAQPRVWPISLLAQTGLFLLLLTRFWQRGAETALSLNHPLYERPIPHTTFVPHDPVPATASYGTRLLPLADPIPSPEPTTPSLDQPDPGVFHHEVPPAPPKIEE